MQHVSGLHRERGVGFKGEARMHFKCSISQSRGRASWEQREGEINLCDDV